MTPFDVIPCVYVRNADVPWFVYLIGACVTVVGATASSWQFIAQWLNGVRGRDWPTVSAVVDLVSVQERVESTGKGDIMTWVASLTYVYRNPDLQTGDYDRSFLNQDDALAWANSLRGCTVMIHVDPRDPSRSALRKEDLDKAATPSSTR
ncbi:MAG TPA: hypothetical protein VHZ25_18000 [Acidobacteriaceae bacterium]|jgi:hypothetical protein|nr:hypothetical protein [Acidobacteriaceae bacterium]